jgi:acetoin utilization deacetylase AcuC-like enzyme
VKVLFYADERFAEHDTGPYHPERPERLVAVRAGLDEYALSEAVRWVEPRPATDAELQRVHPSAFVDGIERFCGSGRVHIDDDTVVCPVSAELARLASGAGIDAVDRLRAGEASAAFLPVRPPGHHATATRAMGFCLYNHVAVAAAHLVAAGDRVAIVDIDAHHGNGTQDIFIESPEVLYVSWHQSPMYPGTGAATEVGEGPGRWTTLNLPMPAGATGEHYRRGLDDVVAPAIAEHGADWLLISAGFDGHRRDPLTDLGLTSGDFADVTAALCELVPAQRVAVFLEGGYDLEAVSDSSAATVAALLGERLHPEAPSSGGPGAESVDAAVTVRSHRDS